MSAWTQCVSLIKLQQYRVGKALQRPSSIPFSNDDFTTTQHLGQFPISPK